PIGHPAFLTRLTENLGLERHAFERILFLAPIIWAGFLFGMKGAAIASFAALALMLPRALLVSPFSRDSIFESFAVFIAGNAVALTFDGLRKERDRRIQLTAINEISRVASQSLELGQVLGGSIESVIGVMKVDAALVFLVDDEAGMVALAAHDGVSERFVQSVGRIKLGEGHNGRVAQTGEPVLVQEPSVGQRSANDAAWYEGIESQMIVPLRSRDKVLGTLCVAMRSHRQFPKEEVDLLIAIGNQIGVAVENARLYEKERQIAQELRISEANYRGLFEGANDAIWIQDLEGNILEANQATEKLTGYSAAELYTMSAAAVLDEEGLGVAKKVRQSLLGGDRMEQPYEQHLIRKDGGKAVFMLTTSLISRDGKPVAFQHIARDVTEQKRMQENLRFYLQQATRAQEEERKRIARELHDDTIQSLVVLSRQLDSLASNAGVTLSKEQGRLIDSLWQQTNGIMEGVRRLSQDLRPPTLDRLGLLPALEWLCSDVEKRSGIKVRLEVHGDERRFAEQIELVLFRIVQEALTNVWRHSGAAEAGVVVEFGAGTIRIAIRDNGKGFGLPRAMGDLARDGRLGLAGMEERARLLGGELRIESDPGKGTNVIIEAPC
ncbi:MAG: PAS domain S-box protein, partial [Dehalococcoidia bacterium]|nr:PAS domain S-box protein [Dehalococcoidia bacterium]